MESSATFKVVLSLFIIVQLLGALCSVNAGKPKGARKAQKIGKDITDYTDADVHRLLDQWDVRKTACLPLPRC